MRYGILILCSMIMSVSLFGSGKRLEKYDGKTLEEVQQMWNAGELEEELPQQFQGDVPAADDRPVTPRPPQLHEDDEYGSQDDEDGGTEPYD